MDDYICRTAARFINLIVSPKVASKLFNHRIFFTNLITAFNIEAAVVFLIHNDSIVGEK